MDIDFTMNERIKKLAEKSSIAIHPRKQTGSAVDCVCGSQFDIEKFAELIIKECASIARREEYDPYECILKHFGIETVDNTLRTRSTYFRNNR